MNVLANSIDTPLKIYRKQSLNNLESIEYVSECVTIKIIINLQWVVPEKNPHPPDGWDSGNSCGSGAQRPWKSRQGGGVLN